jgi:hypothetical protein
VAKNKKLGKQNPNTSRKRMEGTIIIYCSTDTKNVDMDVYHM